MARRKTTSIAAINIVLEKHTPEEYVAFWQALYLTEKPIIVRGDTALMIGSYQELIPGDPESGIRGDLYRFLELDLTQEWFDKRSSQPAKPEVVQREVRIPRYLAPNLTTFEYVFFPKGHRLMFEIKDPENKTLGIGTVEKLIFGLLNEKEVANAFPGARATVEQSHESLKEMFKLHRLEKLTIVLERPNPDGGASAEAAMLEKLRSQGAKRQQVVLDAQKGESLRPDHDIQLMAKVAMSNGLVIAEGKEDRKKKVVESKDHPRIEIVEHTRKEQPTRARFLEGARAFLEKILNLPSGQSGQAPEGN